jgi:hypothetical protein
MGCAAASNIFRSPAARTAAGVAVAALIALDYLWVPFPLRDLPRPAYLDALARLPAGLAVIDVPTGAGPRAAEDMFLQTRHRRPIAGGYVSKQPPSIRKTLAAHPVLEEIFKAHPERVRARETLPEAMRALGIGIAVVHLDRATSRLEARQDEVERRRPADLYAPRLFDPERGMLDADLERFRGQLREAFGEPAYADADAEVYLAR